MMSYCGSHCSDGIGDVMQNVAPPEPLVLTSEDYLRLQRAVAIYAELRATVQGKSKSDLEKDRLLTLAVLRLIDTLGTNLAKIGARSKLHVLDWNAIVGIKAQLPKVKTVPNFDHLWHLLSNHLPEVIARVEHALSQAKPVDPALAEKENPLLTVRKNGADGGAFRLLFKPATSKITRGAGAAITPILTKLCNLEDPSLELARVQMEVWFQRLNEVDRKTLYGRLLTTDTVAHTAAFYELLFHEIFANRGWLVEHQPVVGESRPDFLISTDEFKFYLEVLSVWDATDVLPAHHAIVSVLELLNEVALEHLISLRFNATPSALDRNALCQYLKRWLADLPLGSIEQHHLHIHEHGLDAIITARARNHIVSNCSVYEWFLPPMPHCESELAVDRALTKNTKYMNGVGVPFVLAVCGRDNLTWDIFSILQGLFGDLSVSVCRDSNRVVTLHHNGRGLSAERNTRISAIAFCNRRWIRNQLVTDMVVIHNPWAQYPLSADAFSNYSQLKVKDKEPVRLMWEAAPLGKL